MALTTEQVIETVSKITGLPHGLFKEQVPPRTRGGLTNFVFDCDAESDEYSILVNAKDEIIEIKNAYNTWGQAMIAIALNPPPPLAQRPDPSNNTMTTGAFQSVPYVPPPPMNMPPQINITPINFSNVAQYIADYIKLNPGCIYSLFDPSNPTCVNEVACHNHQVWDFNVLENTENHLTNTKVYRFDFRPNSGDSSIDDQVAAFVDVDPQTMNIISINIEG